MATFAAWSALAQGGPAATFTAPGAFTAGDATFPAGTYTIRQDQDTLQEWVISNDSQTYSAFVTTQQVDTTAPIQKTEITFHKYGDYLVLKQIAIAGLNTRYVVQTSYPEKKAAKSGKPTKVSVPAEKK
jgi:hypothetical protein